MAVAPLDELEEDLPVTEVLPRVVAPMESLVEQPVDGLPLEEQLPVDVVPLEFEVQLPVEEQPQELPLRKVTPVDV